MDHNKNKIFGDTPLYMARIDGFPWSDDLISLYYYSIFGVSPDQLGTKQDAFKYTWYKQI